MVGDYAKSTGTVLTVLLILNAFGASGPSTVPVSLALLGAIATLFIWPLSRLVNDVIAIRKRIDDSDT